MAIFDSGHSVIKLGSSAEFTLFPRSCVGMHGPYVPKQERGNELNTCQQSVLSIAILRSRCATVLFGLDSGLRRNDGLRLYAVLILM